MSQNSSNTVSEETPIRTHRSWRVWVMAIGLPVWVYISFLAAQQLLAGILWVLNALNVPVSSLNEDILTTIVSLLIYLIMIGLVIWLPHIANRGQVTAGDLGISRMPHWSDILMAPVAFFVYFVVSTALMLAATSLFPSFDASQAQNTGFSVLTQPYEYVLAFVTLVLLAPFAEELLFRGYLFGKLKKLIPVWLAILITSLLFGFIHGAWNLAIDTFTLSLVLCLLRVSTGSIWASILLHMIKNGIAFYILFVNPLLTVTIGG
jgi:uncharacterized protein